MEFDNNKYSEVLASTNDNNSIIDRQGIQTIVTDSVLTKPTFIEHHPEPTKPSFKFDF